MKIDFFTHNPDDNTGSYRIWVRDLSKTLREIGHESEVYIANQQVTSIDSDAIILCKSAYRDCENIKSIFSNSKIGAINIPAGYINNNIDFVITGSPEEMCSISGYENVFIYPLIERNFENVKIKKHKKVDKIRLCFHGHYPHLAKFEPFLKDAIEFISNGDNIELVVITGDPNFEWKVGKPKGINIEYHKYNINTISEIIMSCDIGLVPNVTDMRLYSPEITKLNSGPLGLYETDYFLRFKNKTNGGRAYVFYQHGIPVIHDISPSSFEFMSRCDKYIVSHDSISWARNISKLSDHNIRNKVAKNNYKVFKKYYDPHDHAKKLVSFIENI